MYIHKMWHLEFFSCLQIVLLFDVNFFAGLKAWPEEIYSLQRIVIILDEAVCKPYEGPKVMFQNYWGQHHQKIEVHETLLRLTNDEERRSQFTTALLLFTFLFWKTCILPHFLLMLCLNPRSLSFSFLLHLPSSAYMWIELFMALCST